MMGKREHYDAEIVTSCYVSQANTRRLASAVSARLYYPAYAQNSSKPER